MLYAVVGLILVVAGAVFYLRVIRTRTPQLDMDAIGTEGIVGNGGLAGQKIGSIRWHKALVPAQIDPKSGILVMPEGAAVIIRGVAGGVAFVAPKN